MKSKYRWLAFWVVFFVVASLAFGKKTDGTMSFTVTMEQPNTHYYHVVLRCEGLKGEAQDFKMPSWTPGYYRVC